jgi:hypothetical protein
MKYSALVFPLLLCVTSALAQAPSKMIQVSGDRQIIVQDGTLTQPLVARVLDAQGQPLAGIGTILGPVTNGDPGPTLQDEFGFRGFNVTAEWVDYLAFGFPPPQYTISDVGGFAKGFTDSPNPSPSTYVLGAAVLDGTRNSKTVSQIFFTMVRTQTPPSGKPVVAVEYFNTAVRHYFITANDAEVDALERGVFSNWRRSVGGFAVYTSAVDAPAGVVPVCRFFSSEFTSHFYTAEQTECDAVIAKWPDKWTLETRNAFFVMAVDKVTGQCPATFQPVYRLYAERDGSNHRYVTDAKLRDAMIRQGWMAEGFGSSATVFCSNG